MRKDANKVTAEHTEAKPDWRQLNHCSNWGGGNQAVTEQESIRSVKFSSLGTRLLS